MQDPRPDVAAAPEDGGLAPHVEAIGTGSSESSTPRRSNAWLDSIPRTEHNSLFLDADYGQTTLGPKEQWGPALRLYTSMVFADSRGAGVYWGPDKICFYNEGFAVCCGQAHPFLMGRGFYEAFPELEDLMRPVFENAAAVGRTVDVNDMLLFPERNGFVEETYFIGQFIPLRGDSGEIQGLYNTVVESTAARLHERRRRVLDLIAALPLLPVGDTLAACVEALQSNPHDITAAMLYAYEETAEETSTNLRLRGSVGIPERHHSAPRAARLETSQDGLVPYFRKAKLMWKPLVLSTMDNSLQALGGLLDGVEWRGYGEPSRDLVISPLAVGDTLLGFYVQGINPRRPYDETYRTSVADLTMQLQAKWMTSISKEEVERRQQVLESRASKSENRLRELAKSAPVGMVRIGPDADIQWANEQFYDITGLDPSEPDMAAFELVLAEEERGPTLTLLGELLSGAPRVTREIRLRRTWTPPCEENTDPQTASAWLLATYCPVEEEGEVKHLLGYVTDISPQKWAESIQTLNAAAATLAKRRQEDFIDLTCHEMRNPLSAIFQLADGIAQSVPTGPIDSPNSWRDIARDSAAAASTILACAAHQKRVVDDVLMLSQLDSHMLSINPVADQPSRVVAAAVQMFDGEVRMNGTEFTVARHQSADPRLEYVLVDSSRLTQVLINLISNAIKFQSSGAVRKISVTYGAQTARPSELQTPFGPLRWVRPVAPERKDSGLRNLRDREKSIYLHFTIQDTGPGMSPDQMGRLFKRFSQATSKSHVSYGGSGLGLFICRELVEKQGGRVGVASELGRGSSFAFYIESRAAEAPAPKPDRTCTPPAGAASPLEGTNGLTTADTLGGQMTHGQALPLMLKGIPGDAAPPQSQNLHVLLVEDNQVNQRVLAKQLRLRNCTVAVANDGAEALQILKNSDGWRNESDNGTSPRDRDTSIKVDIVLIDVEMPVMNGLQCARHIRELESERLRDNKLPIIALTANARQGQKDRAIAAGMDAVLSKPVTVTEVLTKLREMKNMVDDR